MIYEPVKCCIDWYLNLYTPINRCDHSCYECLGPGERNCSSCVSGYNLETGACVVSTICKDGEFDSVLIYKMTSICLSHTSCIATHMQNLVIMRISMVQGEISATA